MDFDIVNKPKHYNMHSSSIECIEIVQHLSFCLGNAVKYIWRAALKNENPIEDYKKAIYYLKKELEMNKNYVDFPHSNKIFAELISKLSKYDDLIGRTFKCIINNNYFNNKALPQIIKFLEGELYDRQV